MISLGLDVDGLLDTFCARRKSNSAHRAAGWRATS
jgi:hypothetical protein